MQITNTPNMYNNVKNYYKNSQTSFKGVKTLSSIKDGRSIEYGIRVLSNKFNDLLATKKSKEIVQSIANIKVQPSRLYMEQLSEIGRLYGTQKVIEVNIEDEILEKLAQKGESIVFIMNHSNQSEDPQMLAVLTTLLSDAYKKTGKEYFPLPKIILNEDILKTMNPVYKKAFENCGAVGIDASLNDANKEVNVKAFFPLVKDFIRDKCNIFIFPEGRLAIRRDLELYDRFQGGVTTLINNILGIKKNVTVVPVGFAYGGKSKGIKGEILGEKGLNSMSIGTPIQIKRVGDTTTITCGDILKQKDSILFNFFNEHKDEIDVTITSNKKAVKQNEIPGFLKTILCENLEINTNLAKQKLLTPLKKGEFDLY